MRKLGRSSFNMNICILVLMALLHATTVSARGGRTNPRNVNLFTRSERGETVKSTGPKTNTLDGYPYKESPLSSRTLDETIGVIIGGAGMSGVSAASALARSDMDDYVVLEASQRIGGRMYPVTLGSGANSYTVERGANWCTGSERNPFVKMCKKVVDGFDDFFETNIFDTAGMFSQANTNFEEGSECANMDDTYEKATFYADLCVVPGSETTLDSADSQMCMDVLSIAQPMDGDDYSFQTVFRGATGWNPATQSDPAMARACEFFYHDWEFATESDKTSVTGAVTIEDFEGESEYFVADPRGTRAIAEAVAAGALEYKDGNGRLIFDDDNRLQLGTKVLKISWDPNGVNDVMVLVCRTTKTVQPHDHERFPCMSGSENFFTIKGKTFLSTFSLGVLKKSVELERAGTTVEASYNIAPRFDPPLRSIGSLIDVIDGNRLGFYHKVFLQFDKVFWDIEVPYALSAASNGAFVGNFASIFQGLDFMAYPGSKIIYVTVTGERALDMAQKSQTDVLDEILPVLSAMYSTNIQTLYGRSNLVRTDIVDYTFALWSTDPLFYGSYSIGEVLYFEEDYKNFAKGRGNLYFSGEATCANHWGFMHGAMFAGDRTARMVLKERYGRDIDTRSLCEFTVEELEDSDSDEPCTDFLGSVPIVGQVINFIVCLVLSILRFLGL